MRETNADVLLIAVCGLLMLGLWEKSMAELRTDSPDSSAREEVLDGAFWRDQALREIMPSWLAHGIDPASGRFYTGLSREWKPSGTTDQYPTMLGRHLFSLSAAYLLSGEERYLGLARTTASNLMEHGWDQEVGGWYDLITGTGAAKTTICAPCTT